MAARGSNLPLLDLAPDLTVSPTFNLSGAKLATMTQALAYAGIRKRAIRPAQATTVANLEAIRDQVQLHLSRRSPTDASIWSSVQKPEFRKSVSDFLWKSIYGAQKIGKFWRNVSDQEQKGECPVCRGNLTEDMAHILLECEVPGREMLWDLCQQLWAKKHERWPQQSFGTIMGCGLAEFHDEDITSPLHTEPHPHVKTQRTPLSYPHAYLRHPSLP